MLSKLQVGLYATGLELHASHNNQPANGRVEDANGSFIAATLADSGIVVDVLGILDDNMETMAHKLRCNIDL